jgi:hypothetical protein
MVFCSLDGSLERLASFWLAFTKLILICRVAAVVRSSEPDAEHIRFIHACLASPPPTTFLRAVARGYINGPRQFPRLTTNLVRRYMPNSEATARGHLRKSPTHQAHSESQSVSALRRHHKTSIIQGLWKSRKMDPKSKQLQRFDATKVAKSTCLHLDYTDAFPERLSSGAMYLMVSCICLVLNTPGTSGKSEGYQQPKRSQTL